MTYGLLETSRHLCWSTGPTTTFHSRLPTGSSKSIVGGCYSKLYEQETGICGAYTKTRKRHNKPYKLPSCCSYQLCLQDCGTHDQQLTRVLPVKKQNYHTCTVWFLQRSKYHRPACTFGIFCQRGFYSEAARCCYFL